MCRGLYGGHAKSDPTLQLVWFYFCFVEATLSFLAAEHRSGSQGFILPRLSDHIAAATAGAPCGADPSHRSRVSAGYGGRSLRNPARMADYSR
jgi:hypothetical protein